MILAWLAIALLSVSWLLGLNYYHQAEPIAWAVVSVVAVAILPAAKVRLPNRRLVAIALLLAIPAVVLAFWPHQYAWKELLYHGRVDLLFNSGLGWPQRTALVLLAGGLALDLAVNRWRRLRQVAAGIALAGIVLLAQALTIEAYAAQTARSHELPAVLRPLIVLPARLLGVDVGASGDTMATFSMRQTHQFGLTWEWLLDPATACFLIGGVVLISARVWSHRLPGRRRGVWALSVGLLLLLTAAWLPLRAGLMLALFLHDVLRTQYEQPLTAMLVFYSAWLHLLMLLPPALLAWRFLPRLQDADAEVAEAMAVAPAPRRFRLVAAPLLSALGVGLLTAAYYWEPVGQRANGRVLVEEYNPNPSKVWEPTDKPMDTEWYGHLSGYNYYAIVDFSSRFYDVARLVSPINDEALKDCDVLILKVPTRPYADAEIDSIRRFVERGGGLLLIGEHTNVFDTGRNLNDVAMQFGFRFRYDCLFGIDAAFDDRYELPLVPHPALQTLPGLDFATSCSIEPGPRPGRAVICATGLKNLGPDYHVDNYYPQPLDRADMRYGAFIQAWATNYGRGRVLAFTDSTVFSNFSTFEPGKPELWFGLIEWLNHRDAPQRLRWLWLGLGAVALVGAMVLGWEWPGAWLLLLAAGLTGFTGSVVVVRTIHAVALPPPPPLRTWTQVNLDQTISGGKLPRNGFIAGEAGGFGIFERWILRLGYFTSRRSGPNIFDGQMVIFAYPNQVSASAMLDELKDYVAGGGKVLVIDSPANSDSTANELLAPFGLKLEGRVTSPENLQGPAGWPSVPQPGAAAVVHGGEPLLRLGAKTVAASVRQGRGLVVAVGCGTRFDDSNMGVTGDVEPDAELRKVYDLQFRLLRAMISDRLPPCDSSPTSGGTTPKTQSSQDAPAASR